MEATPQLPRPQMGVSSLEARQASHGQASTNPGLPTGRGLTQPNRVDSLATGGAPDSAPDSKRQLRSGQQLDTRFKRIA